MSIDEYFWAPSGIRNCKSTSYRRYKSWGEMMRAERPVTAPHQVFLAHEMLTDEQYAFQSAEDARWFWDEGYQERLCLDNEGRRMSFDRMVLWIDGEETERRGYSNESLENDE